MSINTIRIEDILFTIKETTNKKGIISRELVINKSNINDTKQSDTNNYIFSFPELLKKYKNIIKITILDDISKLNKGCFENIISLKEIILPQSLKYIEEHSFRNCKNLSLIKLPTNIIKLGEGTFLSCSNLQSIQLSKNVTKIPKNCFYDCSKLSKIYIDNSIPYEGDIQFLNNITTLDDYCFERCSSIKNVYIPNTVNNIGTNVFANCENLLTAKIDANITELPQKMFNNCERLQHVILSNALSKIEANCFCGCSKLDNIILPEELHIIEDNAFKYCSTLKEIQIPFNVKSIGKNAFSDCTSVEKIDISAKYIDSIGKEAFYNCPNVKEIIVPQGKLKNSIFDFNNMPNLKRITYNTRHILDLNENEKFKTLINNKKFICICYENEAGENQYKITTSKTHIQQDEMDKKLDISNTLSELCNHDIFKTNSLCDSDKILICLNMLSFLEKDTCLFLLNKLYENDKNYFVNTQNNNEFSKNNSIFSKIKFSIFNRDSKSNNTIKYKGISGIDKLQMISKALNDKINDMRKQHISMDKCNDDYNTCFVNNIPQIVSSENLIELNNILDNLHQLKNDRSGRTFKEKYLYKPGNISGNISRKEDTYNSSHRKSQDDYNRL